MATCPEHEGRREDGLASNCMECYKVDASGFVGPVPDTIRRDLSLLSKKGRPL